ncbi:MAG: ribosome biogenesis GTP-binding protein YihA/YsxC [Alphaproteobacteria bacterium]
MTTEYQEYDAAALEAGRLLFAQSCDFVSGANSLQGLPPDGLTEVAFAGRSNVGKSSLVNCLTGRNTLARTSNTPGRTRQVNFFNLGDRLMLVDLPGYGYARAPKSDIAAWTALIEAYLRGRPSLRRTCLLIDGRHGLKDSDKTLMAMLDEAAVVYQIVLTKCDKLTDTALAKRREEIHNALAAHAAAYPEIVATSARAGTGVDNLRAGLAALAEPRRLR